jgi:predicted nucleic acid binding AN1-type Zn finger protein
VMLKWSVPEKVADSPVAESCSRHKGQFCHIPDAPGDRDVLRQVGCASSWGRS